MDILKLIRERQNVLILTHSKPDGDAVGSATAMAFALKHTNNVKMMFDDYNPRFDLLHPNEFLTSSIQNADAVVVLDCANKNRLGKLLSLTENTFVINIDHHISNDNFGDVNCVCSNASSTAEIVFELLKDELNSDIALAIYVGIISDTDGFRHSCTSKRTHEIVAKLYDFDLPFSNVYNELINMRTMNEVRNIAKTIENLEVISNIAISFLNLDAQTKTTAGLIDFIKSIKKVTLAVMIIETEPFVCKVSFRSDDIDVNKLAEKFDGGGHKFAAGCVINTDALTAKQHVLNLLKEFGYVCP